MSEQNGSNPAAPPAEIAEFMRKIGPRQLTPDEARALNLLRLKHGLPGANVSGVAAHIAEDSDKD